MKRVTKVILKFIAVLAIAAVSILALAIVALQFPAVQGWITNQVTHSISNKTGTRVEIGEINLSFPKYVLIKDVFLEDQAHDTLASIGTLKVDLDFLQLFKKEINLDEVILEDAIVNINRQLPDSSFNFDFLTRLGADSSTSEADKTVPENEQGNNNAWQVSLDGIYINNVFFTYKDQVSGQNIRSKVGLATVDLNDMDIANNKFFIDKISLMNSYATIIQEKVISSSDTSQPPAIQLKEVQIQNVKLNYKDLTKGEELKVDVGSTHLLTEDINLKDQRLVLQNLQINNSRIAYNVASVSESKEGSSSQGNVPMEWKIKLRSLQLNNNSFLYNVAGKPKIVSTIDPNHLNFRGIGANIKNIDIKGTNVKADIAKLTFKEKSGYNLTNLQSKLIFTDTRTELKNLDLTLGKTHIKNYLLLKYKSLDQLSSNPGHAVVKANLKGSQLRIADLAMFDSSLTTNPNLKGVKDNLIYIEGEVNGLVSNVRMDNFFAHVSNTTIKLDAEARGLPGVDSTYFTIALNGLTTSGKDIRRILPGIVPSTIELPASISATGRMEGYLNDFNSSLTLNSSLGRASTVLTMTSGSNSVPAYNARINVTDFDLAKLLKDTLLGPVTLSADIKGRGLDTNTINTSITANVQKAEFRKYIYKNINLSAQVERTKVNADLKINDKNLVAAFNGVININPQSPLYDFTLRIEGADLYALNLSKKKARFQGTLISDIQGSDINNINGNIGIKDVVIIKEDKKYGIDSLLFASINQDDKTEMKIESSILSAKFSGNVRLGKLVGTLTEHLNQYFPVTESKAEKAVAPQNFDFELKINDPDLITELFIPDLKFRPATVTGKFSSSDNILDIVVNTPRIIYKTDTIDSLNLYVRTNADHMDFSVSISKYLNPQMKVENLSVSGVGKNDTINLFALIKEEEKERFALSGDIVRVGSAIKLHFDSPLKMEETQWTVSRNNSIIFNKGKVSLNNISFSNGQSSFTIRNKIPYDPASGFAATFKDFDIGIPLSIVKREKLLAGGVVNGSAYFNSNQKDKLSADLEIENFSYLEDTLGNITLNATRTTKGGLKLLADVTGNGNLFRIKGGMNEKGELNLDLSIDSLNLASIESFFNGEVTRLSGIATGNLKVTGTSAFPSIRGAVSFPQAAFNITYLNAYYRVFNEQIKVDDNSFLFQSFGLLDTMFHKALITGYVCSYDFKYYTFDLNVVTKDFLVLNTSPGDNEMFYGTAVADSRIHLTGDNYKPVIDIRAKLKEGSVLTFLTPESKLTEETREGVVEFVSQSPKDSILLRQDTAKAAMARITGIDLNANVEIDEETELRVIVDQVTGDSLVLTGNTTFSLGVDPSGKIALTGNYEITEGSYRLSLNDYIKKNFIIQKGSKITWTGDPLKAEADITAIYTVRTSSADLLAGQISNLTPEQQLSYRQKLPFDVYLYMKENLLTPDITFRIDLPPDQRDALNGTVYARLNVLNENESELTQQVFALLVLNRFIPNDPLQIQNEGPATFVRTSASKILTRQLNYFISNYFPDTELDVTINSYEDYYGGSPQGRTDLQFRLFQEMMNERLALSAGGNYELEGQDKEEDVEGQNTDEKKNGTENLAGDVSLEYKLTEDGRYRVRALRKSTYEGVFEGALTKNALGIIFTKDYNRLSELFKRTEDKDEIKLPQE